MRKRVQTPQRSAAFYDVAQRNKLAVRPEFSCDLPTAVSNYIVGREGVLSFAWPRFYRSNWRVLRIDGFDNSAEWVLGALLNRPDFRVKFKTFSHVSESL